MNIVIGALFVVIVAALLFSVMLPQLMYLIGRTMAKKIDEASTDMAHRMLGTSNVHQAQKRIQAEEQKQIEASPVITMTKMVNKSDGSVSYTTTEALSPYGYIESTDSPDSNEKMPYPTTMPDPAPIPIPRNVSMTQKKKNKVIDERKKPS